MKKIDWLLVKSFIPPFLATFFIAMFVLVLQFFWQYIDDIIGKGITFFYFIEFLFYLSITFLPLSLPIAVLLSSVMVMGNMAEKHELTALKSAGVSLSRILRPLIVLCFGIAILSFFANNNLIPYANLKKFSRLYDLKKSKPTMSLEPGTFNDDFSNINIYLQDKDKESGRMYGMMIYDHSENQKYSLITADSGMMMTDEQTNNMMMKLFDGHQYQETSPKRSSNSRFPFVRTTFSTWQRYLDLSEFEVDNTDEDLFKGNQKIMKAAELIHANDSLAIDLRERKGRLKKQLLHYIDRDISDSTSNKVKEREARFDKSIPKQPIERFLNSDILADSVRDMRLLDRLELRDKKLLLNKSLSSVNTIISQSDNQEKVLFYKHEKIVKVLTTLHSKFSLAFTCILFLFIGAPMGAIIRKGGFGYPLLVAIFFFVVYIILTTYYRKLAESFQMEPVLSSWMPVIVLLPIGIFLTAKAMNDSKLSIDLGIRDKIRKLLSIFSKKNS